MNDRIDPEIDAIEALVQDYFLGMYEGDVERLRRIFDPRCWLFGENSSGSLEFSRAGFLDQIGSEPVPKAEGEPFDMRLVSLDRTSSVATAKVEVRYQGRRYTDYLMLQKHQPECTFHRVPSARPLAADPSHGGQAGPEATRSGHWRHRRLSELEQPASSEMRASQLFSSMPLRSAGHMGAGPDVRRR